MIDLSKPDLRKVPLGTQVKTTKGFVWKLVTRVGTLESWIDETSERTWTDTNFKGTWLGATNKFSDALPTKRDFEEAEAHGIREIMHLNDRCFWSSSVVPGNDDGAYVFDGYDGGVDYHYGDDYEAALCVSGGR